MTQPLPSMEDVRAALTDARATRDALREHVKPSGPRLGPLYLMCFVALGRTAEPGSQLVWVASGAAIVVLVVEVTHAVWWVGVKAMIWRLTRVIDKTERKL